MTSPNLNQQEIILAALLYDLEPFRKTLENQNGQDISSLEKCLSEWPTPTGCNSANIAKIVQDAYQDQPESEEGKLIIEASLTAFGLNYKSGSTVPRKFDQFSGLRSVFEEIALEKNLHTHQSSWRYPLITLDKNCYPEKDSENGEKLRSEIPLSKVDWIEHWRNFQTDLNNRKEKWASLSFSNYLGALLAFLENYWWCLPSAGSKDILDVSLYDHAYLTAALAQALWLHRQAREQQNSPDSQEPFILLGGDLSGIQDYIFNIDHSFSAGVSKLFRARSFYLQLLTKVAILELLKECSPGEFRLESIAKIMDAGGRFILLLPNTAAVAESLKEFQVKLQKQLYQKFKGLIGLNIYYKQLGYNEFDLASFNDTLNSFLDELDKQKLTKLQQVMDVEFSPLFKKNYSAKGEGNCQLCNTYEAKPNTNSELRRCQLCDFQIEIIGTKIPHNDYFILEDVEKSEKQNKEDNAENLLFKWNVRFIKEPKSGSISAKELIFNFVDHKDYAFHPLAGNLPSIKEEDINFWQNEDLLKQLVEKNLSDDQNNVSIEDYIRDKKWEAKSKDFGMIAHSRQGIANELSPKENKNVEQVSKRGKPFLGVFKADVDNLGFIFSTGLPKERYSISRFASLSRMLNYFFSVELMCLIEDGDDSNYYNPHKKDIYVVYSGGDDVFFIGPWVLIVHFAIQLREKFQQFVTENPDITLSAGIGVFRHGYPIKNIAPDTDELLEQAKSFPKDLQHKNAVTLFQQTVHWDDFRSLIQEEAIWWDHLFYEGKVPTALGYRFLEFSDQYQRFMGIGKYKDKKDVKAGRCLSQMAYYFARNVKADKLGSDINKLIDYKDNPEKMENLRIPLFYSLYRNRN